MRQPRRRNRRLIWLPLLVTVAGCSASQVLLATADVLHGGSSEIEGTWKGVYFDYPNLMVLKLNVRTLPMDHIEGDCEISQAIEPKSRNTAVHA